MLPGHLTSEPNTAGSRGLAIASVRRSIAAMAIVTGKEQVMQPTPPNPPDKEGPFLPWLETQGHPGPASVIIGPREQFSCIILWGVSGVYETVSKMTTVETEGKLSGFDCKGERELFSPQTSVRCANNAVF